MPVARAAAADHAPAAEAKGLYVQARDAPDGAGPSVAHADPAALARAVGEVVGNAVRFTEAGGVRVSVEAGVDEVAVVVSDTGIGMEPGFLAHATEPFRQASEGHGRTHEGLGVGLALARRLVEAMGGRLDLESLAGVGTTVRLVLPRAADVPRAAVPAEAPRSERRPPGDPPAGAAPLRPPRSDCAATRKSAPSGGRLGCPRRRPGSPGVLGATRSVRRAAAAAPAGTRRGGRSLGACIHAARPS